MDLSDAMRAELERRLNQTAVEQRDDPAFRDLPRVDLYALLVLAASAIAGVVLLQRN